MKYSVVIGFCLSLLGVLHAQDKKVNNHIYEGNSKVKEASFVDAEKSYRKALSLAPEESKALFNLGNTHYQEEQYDEASQRFFQTQKAASSKDEKHRAFHNLGNVFMQKKEYEKAVEAYKNALRNNPSDEETRYNYALAKELLDKEEPPQEQEQDDNKDNQDQQEKEQEQEQEKDQDKEEDQDSKDQQNQDDQKDEGEESDNEGDPKNEGDQQKDQNQPNNPQEEKKQPPKQGELSPQQVQSLLEAMNNQEKEVQDKVNAKKVKGVPVRGKKDW